MTDLDLDAIEARANAASDGPWIVVHEPAWEADDVQHPDVIKVGAPLYVGDDEPFTVCLVSIDHEDDPVDVLGDAEFIAHARTDVPALVAEVRRLHALLDRIAYPALMYDTRVYMLSEDAPELLDRLNPTQRALVGERPSEVDARVENERDEARATIARVRAMCERYERADTERLERVSVETLAAKVLNALDGAS